MIFETLFKKLGEKKKLEKIRSNSELEKEHRAEHVDGPALGVGKAPGLAEGRVRVRRVPQVCFDGVLPRRFRTEAHALGSAL